MSSKRPSEARTSARVGCVKKRHLNSSRERAGKSYRPTKETNKGRFGERGRGSMMRDGNKTSDVGSQGRESRMRRKGGNRDASLYTHKKPGLPGGGKREVLIPSQKPTIMGLVTAY